MLNRRWNVALWAGVIVLIGGSAASLVVWPVHKKASTVEHRAATKPERTRSAPRPHASGQRSKPPKSPPPAAPNVKLFVFAARGPSRVLVRRSTSYGPVVFDSTLARGGTLKVSGTQLYARVSQIANVNVRVNTRMVDLTCTAAGGVILTPTRAIPMQPPDCPKPPSDAS